MFCKSHFSDIFQGKNHIFRMFFRAKSHFSEFSRGEEDAITSQLNP